MTIDCFSLVFYPNDTTKKEQAPSAIVSKLRSAEKVRGKGGRRRTTKRAAVSERMMGLDVLSAEADDRSRHDFMNCLLSVEKAGGGGQLKEQKAEGRERERKKRKLRGGEGEDELKLTWT